jgi:ABC-type sugar transport system substrate-binding protein
MIRSRHATFMPLMLAALVAVTAAGGCSSGGGKKAAEKASQEATGGPRLKIAMITHSAQGDAFWDIVQKGAQAAAAKDNVDFDYSADPEGGRQAQLVQAAIDRKVDGIIVTLAKPEALRDVLKKASDAKIPFVTINSGADKSAEYGALTHFGQDETIAGQAAGEELKKLGVKKAICVIHEQGNVGLEQRCAGAKKTFGGSLENLSVQGSNMPQVKSTVNAKLQDKSVDGVLTLNAAVAMTSVEAAKEAANSAKVATFDLNKQLIGAITGGTVAFAVDQQPYLQGYGAVDELWLYKRNGNVFGGGQPVLTGPAIVNATNAGTLGPYAERGTR